MLCHKREQYLLGSFLDSEAFLILKLSFSYDYLLSVFLDFEAFLIFLTLTLCF
jgi:hypothetical protein